MAQLSDLVGYCNERLNAETFEDYCPNGLQVEAGEEVETIVSGVTASIALIEAAAERNADLLLVHHGYFWKNEKPAITGMKGCRIRALFANDLSLLAYHLPLDAHPEIGNNALLGANLKLPAPRALECSGLLWGSELAGELPVADLAPRIERVLRRRPLHIEGGADSIKRVAWCSGGAQSYIDKAADLGYDAFISGEISESTVHIARERRIHYFAAGHHATERFGVQALGEELAQRFGLQHRFVDIPNPA